MGGNGTVSFSSIPQTYSSLKLIISARSDRVATSDPLFIQFNGSSDDIYHSILIDDRYDGTTNTLSTVLEHLTTDHLYAAHVAACDAPDSTFSVSEIIIPKSKK